MRGRSTTSNFRRSALASALVLLSLIAHSMAAASLPSMSALLGGGVVAGALAWMVAGQRRSVPWLVAIFFAGQLLIHASVVALGHHGVSYLPDQRMLFTHLLAAVVVAVIFARGEQLAAAWARAAAHLLGVRHPLAVEIPTRGALLTRYVVHIVEIAEGSPLSRRGPPASNGVLTFA